VHVHPRKRVILSHDRLLSYAALPAKVIRDLRS
jgi:hypothetical protein